MKKLLIFLFLLFITLCGYSQNVVNIVMNKNTKLFDAGWGDRKSIADIHIGDTLTVLSYDFTHLSYYVLHKQKNINGFIFEYQISDFLNIEEINNSLKKRDHSNNRASGTRSELEIYKERYGKPDDTSSYSSGNYKSITYTWYCAQGKYRQIDFVWKNGRYVKNSEYTSGCIR